MVGKYTLEGKTMYWVYNYSSKANSVTVNVNGASGYDIYDPVNGSIEAKAGGSLTVSIGAGNAKLIVVKTK